MSSRAPIVARVTLSSEMASRSRLPFTLGIGVMECGAVPRVLGDSVPLLRVTQTPNPFPLVASGYPPLIRRITR